MSYESTVDELSYVLGPALVGLLASAVAPWLPLALGAATTLVLVPLFAAHPSGSRTPTAGPGVPAGKLGPGWTRPVAARLGVVFAGMVAMGTVFGSTAAGTVAFAGLHGEAAAGGLLYAGMGLTSAVAALSVAFWSPRWPHAARWIGCAALVLPGSLLLQVPTGLPGIVVALLVFGAPVGPLMVTVFALAGKVSPVGRMGTVMSLMASGNVIGTALGQALAGVLSDAFGHRGAYAVATGAAVVLMLTGALAAALEARSRDTPATADAATGEERARVPDGTASGASSTP